MFIIIIKVSTYLFLSVMYTSKYKNHSDNVVFQMRLNSDMEFIADNLQLMLSISCKRGDEHPSIAQPDPL